MNAQVEQRSARGALRDQLNQINNPPRVFIDPATIPGRVMFWRILLEPFIPRYDGKIVTPDMIERAEEIQSTVGRIVQIGPFAFKSHTAAGLDLSQHPDLPVVGNFVIHEMYAGQVVRLKDGGKGKKLRAINETEILMVIDDPEQIGGYL